jgi:hypothetical protein
MKKLFIVLAVASLGFVACNNESKTETKEDTTTVTPTDTSSTVPPVDTTSTMDTTAKADTLKK